MKNIINLKALLRLIGTGVLTTVAASSVVACGETNPVTSMDAKVSQNLGLINQDGKALIKASIDMTVPATPKWKTDLSTATLATKLVNGTSGKVVGKDDDSTAFLKDVLKLIVDGDNKFNYDDVKAISAKVDKIVPTIAANKTTTDYVVTGGTYMLQFYAKDGLTKLGDNFSVNVANDDATGIVNDAIPKTLVRTDFDTAGDLSTFSANDDVQDLLGKTTTLTTTSPSAANQQMVAVMKLIDKTATFTVSAQSKTPAVPPATANKWASGDTLTLTIKTSDVTTGFTTKVTLTL